MNNIRRYDLLHPAEEYKRIAEYPVKSKLVFSSIKTECKDCGSVIEKDDYAVSLRAENSKHYICIKCSDYKLKGN